MLVLNKHWLQSWLSKTIGSTELVESFLLKQGFEMEPVGSLFTQDIVVGEIISVQPHANADKLNVCTVSIGQDDDLTIVCGCPSVKAGIKVAVATVGTELGSFTIEERKIRGTLSCGMLCSMKELGFNTPSTGIWHLGANAPVGQPLDKWLERSSERYGIELTPNRGDCLSARGMAREFAIGLEARSIQPWADQSDYLKLPCQATVEISSSASHHVSSFDIVKLKKPEPGDYTTPDWMAVRLLEAGIGLNHCVVDILNYVMLETGQPMHAYSGQLSDAFSLGLGHGESLTTLGGKSVLIDEQTLVVKNAGEPVCIAGYMGGMDSACAVDDEEIYVEAAAFSAEQIAYHCRKFIEFTHSGSRFERGIDCAFTRFAMQRALDLLAQYAGYVPVYRLAGDCSVSEKDAVEVPVDFPSQVLGFSYTVADMQKALVTSGCSVDINDDLIKVVPPTWRNDITIAEDIVSELLRLLGMPADLMPGVGLTLGQPVTTFGLLDRLQESLRDHMIGMGFYETFSYSFDAYDDVRLFHDSDETIVTLVNPISPAFGALRSSLFPGLLKQVKRNLAKQAHDVRLFEVGHCFVDQSSEISERLFLGAAFSGSSVAESWYGSRPFDFYYAKSMLCHLMSLFGVSLGSVTWQSVALPGLHPHQCGQFVCHGQVIASCGLLHPAVSKSMKINQNVFFVDMDLDWLLLSQSKGESYHKVSNQPMMRRDLSLVVPNTVSFEEIKQEIQHSIFQYLQKIVIFDKYNGSQIPSDCYSVSIGLLFQDAERTLQDEDLVPMLTELINNLDKKLKIKPRGGKVEWKH